MSDYSYGSQKQPTTDGKASRLLSCCRRDLVYWAFFIIMLLSPLNALSVDLTKLTYSAGLTTESLNSSS